MFGFFDNIKKENYCFSSLIKIQYNIDNLGGIDMKKPDLEENPVLKKKLKKIGFTLTIIGGLCMLIGLIDFFSSVGTFNSPSLFWMLFLGGFLLFPGLVCLNYAYMGKVARYTSSEISPVIKDTTNYLIDGTKDEIIGVINEIKGKSPKEAKKCSNCGDPIEVDEIYCDKCGKKLNLVCSFCETVNDGAAKFCKKCGEKLLRDN